ncbi:MAG: thiamine pyrophosphate-dependent enzyme [Myxococcota bacterium]
MTRPADATAIDRVPFVDRRFLDTVASWSERPRRHDLEAPLREGSALSCRKARLLFSSQLESRHVDLCARWLKQTGRSYYTIGSSGHEGNCAVAAATQPTDPALLHYRSGAFFLQRARQVNANPDETLRDVMLGLTASAADPISGGRHKVIGSLALNIPPQTSTIGSHLPKAVGMAFGLDRARRLELSIQCPADAVIVCSFGDASINHSTSVGAINAAGWAAYQGSRVPILFVCEDNGLGISVATPKNWIRDSYLQRPGLRYFDADGTDLAEAYTVAQEAATYVRRERKPAFLHLRVVRLLGHAGSDVETVYRSLESIERAEARDPLLRTARMLVEAGVASPRELLEAYEETRTRVRRLGEEAASTPKLADAVAVMAPLAPRRPEAIMTEVARAPDPEARRAFWDDKLPEGERPGPLGASLNRAIGDLIVKYPELICFGEDVGPKGGVYGVTRGLLRRSQRGRVFDTLLDEQTILGIAIGASQLGMLPLPEIQYLAYLHNAEDQLRGEAASLQFFSRAQYQNPMVVRIAAYAYQKGFGGHFHNDNSVAVLRDIPGLVIASPARGADATAMLQTCVAAARVDGTVAAFLEPIALYPVRDLHEAGDQAWCDPYDPAPPHIPIGAPRIYHADADDLLIVTWANGLWMSLRVAARLRREGIACRVLDLRWLAPMPLDEVAEAARDVGKVLVVDETRRSGGVSEAIVTGLVERGFRGPLKRVTAHDTFVPLGPAADTVLVQEPDIHAAALALHASYDRVVRDSGSG